MTILKMIRFLLPKTAFFLFFLFKMGNIASATFSSEWDRHVESTIKILPKFPGWCTPEKTRTLMNFIYEFRPEVLVEIGSFGGSTTYPLVSSLSFIKTGVLYAIDAWNPQVAIEGLQENDPNLQWWANVDMATIYSNFIHEMRPFRKWCKVIRNRSERAVSQFSDESIDFLYIDGNFSSEGSFRDVTLYFPKVKKGGVIWINDADRKEKRSSVGFLMENAIWLREYSIKNRCVVFRKLRSNA